MAILCTQLVCRLCGADVDDTGCEIHPTAPIDGVYVQETDDSGRYQAQQSEFELAVWRVVDTHCTHATLASPCVLLPLLDEQTARREAKLLNVGHRRLPLTEDEAEAFARHDLGTHDQ